MMGSITQKVSGEALAAGKYMTNRRLAPCRSHSGAAI